MWTWNSLVVIRMKNESSSKPLILSLGLAAFAGAFYAGAFWTPSEEPMESAQSETGDAESQQKVVTRLDGISAEECLRRIDAARETRDVFRVHLEAGRAAAELASTEFPAALNEALAREGIQWNVAQLILLLEWARKKPDAMLNYLNTKQPSWRLVSLFFRYWADADLGRAISSIAELEGGARNAAIAGLNGLNSDFVNGELAARGFTNEGSNQEKVEGEFDAALAKKMYLDDLNKFSNLLIRAHVGNPEKALEIALSVTDERIRKRLLKTVAHMRWPNVEVGLNTMNHLFATGQIGNRSDYVELVASLSSRSGGKQELDSLNWIQANFRGHEFLSVVKLAQRQGLGSGDPKGFMESAVIASLPDSNEKRNMISSLVLSWAHKDIDSTIAWVDAYPNTEEAARIRAGIIGTVFEKSGRNAALQLFNQLPPNKQKTAVEILAQNWGRQDPLGYVSWTLDQENPKLLEHAVSRVGNHWAQMDLEEARYFSENLPEGDMKGNFQQSIGSNMARTDPLGAIEYASSIENPATALNIEVNALGSWARSEPRAAMDYIQNVYDEDDTEKLQRLSPVANTWGNLNPEEAMGYFQSAGSEKVQRQGSIAVLNTWINKDVDSALNFVMEKSNSTTRDELLNQAAFNYNILRSQPDRAYEIVEAIANVEMRKQALERLEQRLAQTNLGYERNWGMR